jgi:hypothetical protein
VYYRPCSSCQNKKRYDGFDNRVVWFGSFCISHAVLKDYIRLFITSRYFEVNNFFLFYLQYLLTIKTCGSCQFPVVRLLVIPQLNIINIHFFQLTNVQVLRGVRTTAGFVWKFRVSKADYLYQISSCSYCNDTVCVLHYHYI